MSDLDITVKRGDTCLSDEYVLTDAGGAVNLTGASIRMDVRTQYDGPSLATLTIGNGFTIVNAAQGRFRRDERIWTLAPGTYGWDIEVTIGTWVNSDIQGTLTILPDWSHP